MRRGVAHAVLRGQRHGNKWLTAMLVSRIRGADAPVELPVGSARADREARRHRSGAGRGCALDLVSAWHMLTKDEPYQDLGADWLARRDDEAHARRFVAHLERLGHTVQLDAR
ncbi:hypothetical protein LRP67_18765 [Nocardioides sp. cx-169]|uniref:hypothetical protein n=1 Tax=Nocardioides sp. cx-169 TaxID=2899080 RepID=UPI001E61100D|nr:hypothetical protein [Nocardioides sp. cx-169]MCD4536137.1 hypothetical protein [Nocardioides sp. cx-169]